MHMKLWVERDGKPLFGDGRLQILEAVAQTGSLAGAARRLNMSYRAAWGRIKASEERLGFLLVERDQMGRRAMHLTPEARRLVDGFRRLRAKAEKAVEEGEEELLEILRGAPA